MSRSRKTIAAKTVAAKPRTKRPKNSQATKPPRQTTKMDNYEAVADEGPVLHDDTATADDQSGFDLYDGY